MPYCPRAAASFSIGESLEKGDALKLFATSRQYFFAQREIYSNSYCVLALPFPTTVMQQFQVRRP